MEDSEGDGIASLELYLEKVKDELARRSRVYDSTLLDLTKVEREYLEISQKMRFSKGRGIAKIRSNVKLRGVLKSKLLSLKEDLRFKKQERDRAEHRLREITEELERKRNYDD